METYAKHEESKSMYRNFIGSINMNQRRKIPSTYGPIWDKRCACRILTTVGLNQQVPVHVFWSLHGGQGRPFTEAWRYSVQKVHVVWFDPSVMVREGHTLKNRDNLCKKFTLFSLIPASWSGKATH